MSWQIFKDRMERLQQSPDSVSVDNYVRRFVSEYDSCIRRGHDMVNYVPLQKGNTEIMQTIVNGTLLVQQQNPNQGPLLRNLGNAVMSYWTGGIGGSFPVPNSPPGTGIPWIPAPGSFSNIGIVSHTIVSPGQWTIDLPTLPTRRTVGWLDNFIICARAHLQTVSGLITTTSLYPPFGTPGPGIIFWSGYTVK